MGQRGKGNRHLTRVRRRRRVGESEKRQAQLWWDVGSICTFCREERRLREGVGQVERLNLCRHWPGCPGPLVRWEPITWPVVQSASSVVAFPGFSWLDLAPLAITSQRDQISWGDAMHTRPNGNPLLGCPLSTSFLPQYALHHVTLLISLLISPPYPLSRPQPARRLHPSPSPSLPSFLSRLQA